LTIGVQPNFATGTNQLDRGMAIGDVKLLSQLRLTRFTPESRIPTIAIVLNEVLPTGKHDRLDPDEEGHGSGVYATEAGINVQHYFLLRNGRLLRARINVLKSFPREATVTGRSVYGTAEGFRGHAKPGSKTTFIAAAEYSLTREWVFAFDVIWESTAKGKLEGRYAMGQLETQIIPKSRAIGFAPAVEYNWSDRTGILFGVWISPKGHNSARSVTPAIAFSHFW
jgi:hypothetical protein